MSVNFAVVSSSSEADSDRIMTFANWKKPK
ncbi:hypothetical protein PR003_g7169 [Phytophthora rubi]|uniref:Uncharacterized protein n=1 Tax=Phytophthora rubi TaxID=129364 RepID=A0A6A3KSJ0_9STRA|nr:hypothetical protein PR001_g17116 [Phytophthora rubi]KAE9346972.1 hypothetical protein PR003_g7169 [Phytophthora rubi]